MLRRLGPRISFSLKATLYVHFVSDFIKKISTEANDSKLQVDISFYGLGIRPICKQTSAASDTYNNNTVSKSKQAATNGLIPTSISPDAVTTV